MTYLSVIVFLLLAAGLFLLFEIDPVAISVGYFHSGRKPKNMRELTAQANGEKKQHFFSRYFGQMQNILALTGRGGENRRYCGLALALSVAGLFLGFALNNPFLAPVLAASGLLLPPLYVMLTANSYSRRLNMQTGSAFALVTSTYLRTENLPLSVKQNLPVMRGPIAIVFAEFWAQTQYISANVEKALQDMSEKLDVGISREWCKTMALCQHDRSKKRMLIPLLNKQHNTQIVQIKLDGLLAVPVKNFWVMIVLMLSSYPILLLFDRSCFSYMFTTLPGKITTAAVAAILFYCLCALMKAVKPISYRR